MRISSLIFIMIFSFVYAADDIGGFWKSLDDDGQPQCVFGIYEHEGIYYGRIIGTYNEEGQMADTIYKPSGRAAGIPGNPHTCGLDIVYDLQDSGPHFTGKILDPSKGKIYNCEMWRENDYLVLRGKLFIFGKNIKWYPTTQSDFPKNFKMPDMKKFAPAVPQL